MHSIRFDSGRASTVSTCIATVSLCPVMPRGSVIPASPSTEISTGWACRMRRASPTGGGGQAPITFEMSRPVTWPVSVSTSAVVEKLRGLPPENETMT